MDDQSKNAVTIFDVAREAGVSYGTVSRVLNNRDHVKPETRVAVMQVVDRLGFVANQQARSLAGGRSQVIGLLLHGLSTGYTDEILRGIDAELEAANYDLMLYTTHRRKLKESAYVATITRGMADGLLLLLPRNSEQYLDSLRAREFPCILIDHQGRGDTEHSVGATNRQGGYDATRYLIGLGHRRIGFVAGTLDLACATDRLEGYRQALADNDIPFDAHLVSPGDFGQPSGFVAGRALLSLRERPTAVFASNDVMALGVMEAARDSGLSIPDDLSIIGFDDIQQAALVYPPLTTIRQPLEEMGRVATQMLLKLIADPQADIQPVTLPTSLVVRQSCRPPRA
ncbi:MAG: LacI family DNA-binding transcriptional regulator [Chloroflexota bacterium]